LPTFAGGEFLKDLVSTLINALCGLLNALGEHFEPTAFTTFWGTSKTMLFQFFLAQLLDGGVKFLKDKTRAIFWFNKLL